MKLPKIASLEFKKNSYLKNEALKKTKKTQKIELKDKIEISSKGKQLNSYIFNKEEDTNINDKKISSIENQIKNGTYKIDSKLIAKKMLKSMKKKY
ncbi:flagellar biosynthesis anti-sigma factor FlgM [Clostridium oceanicum]|uniref:Negative regulator of flagellin synthesis n=1 Tax=Clostridium oceanicum TaxID=1543 RepID=A0ABP3UKJ2_9CLOT